MKTAKPVDYLAEIEKTKQEEQKQQNQLLDPDYISQQPDKPVDYLAASKAWEKKLEGKYVIYTTEQEDEGTL